MSWRCGTCGYDNVLMKIYVDPNLATSDRSVEEAIRLTLRRDELYREPTEGYCHRCSLDVKLTED